MQSNQPKRELRNYQELLGNDACIIDGVLNWFRLFASVPHGSWNEKALSDLLNKTFRERGWNVEQDRWNNLKVDIPATPGYETVAPIIIQGHLDMVCAVTEGSGYVPERDPITLVIKDGILQSDGRSSLGADCGWGISAALYLAEQKLERGPIRMILTVAEEIGLHGAKLVDPEWLKGCKWFINIDGGSTDTIIVSCAGGLREAYTRPVQYAPRTAAYAYELHLSGFAGGHSGTMIHLGRGNAIKLLAHFLNKLGKELKFELADLRGGHGPNAIPLESSAVIVVDEKEKLTEAVERLENALKGHYKVIDPDIKVELREVPLPEQVWDERMAKDAINLIAFLQNGVFAMHATIPGQVAASSNVGLCHITEKNELEIVGNTRCHDLFLEEILATRHAAAAEVAGFDLDTDSYPGYAGSLDNALAQKISQIHEKLVGTPMNIKGVHAGLELGVLGAKQPGLTMVTIGPAYRNGHATTECVPLDQLPLFMYLLAETLENLSNV